MKKLVILLLVVGWFLFGCIPPPYYGGYRTYGTYGYHYYDGYVGEGYYHNYHGHTRYGTPHYGGHGHRR